MQVNKDKRKEEQEEGKVCNLFQMIFMYILTIVWIGGLIFYSVCMFPWFLQVKVEIVKMIVVAGLSMIIITGIWGEAFKLKEESRISKNIRKIIITISAIIMVIIPIILQIVYRATEDNVVKTEETIAVDKREISIFSEDDIEYKSEEGDIFTIRLDSGSVFPSEEIIQYRTTVTTDNQNPWGRKTTKTIREWKEYILYVPNPSP